ncbi:MAG: thermosome subunit beta [Candidatus Woesearchaeota archaeon]|jgi:thermosome
MTQQQQVQPIFILPENTQRTTGKTAQQNNIMAGKLVAETIRTTLGPKGMDKMLVDSLGDIIVTNDGVTILQEMQIEHPAAKMIVEIAKTQESEVGDGTTTAVIIAGELLKNAESLLEKDIHPTVITKGYLLASQKALEILNRIAETVKQEDEQELIKIANTAMTGKGAESAKELLAQLTVKAVQSVTETSNGKTIIDLNNIKIQKRTGASIEDSQLIKGIVLDKERVNMSMPKTILNAKIALIDSAIEIKGTETDAKIQINDPMQMQAFLDQEERMLRKMVDQIATTGATVVLCQKGIDDLAQHFLAKKGICAVRRVKKSDMDALTRATGAKLVTNIDDFSATDLGIADVEEQNIGDENMIFVQNCKNPKAVTILIRGSTEHVIGEVKRAVDDAIGVVAATIRSGKIVAGAGAPEMELAKEIRKYAQSLKGREQLAVLAFADAMEVIPRTLAENAGLDPIDVIAELKAEHDKGTKWAGIDVFTGKVIDAWKENIVEPLQVKTQAIRSAAEVAVMILRIDDVIAAGKKPMPQQQEMPEM